MDNSNTLHGVKIGVLGLGFGIGNCMELVWLES